jgi:uncharacterized protein (DUF1810 family)
MSDLERFVTAQDAVWPDVVAELSAGRKASHWMWFVFPQLRELGRSQIAQHYGIGSVEEARDYLAHPLLGSRLRQVTQLVLDVSGKTAHQIFSSPDDLKFRSCMTLFGAAGAQETLFQAALDRYFKGAPDQVTLDLIAARLKASGSPP